ncbi:MAG: UDP-N-acetylmuramoyl-L-alanine--D-glutamate ligase, partial [Spirochaetaceae bacterium]|nr:UDP-N-acetylmuramoyl-L-alanine--D-glutamate ligase [Spirochaetaceae bacterium]
MSNPHFYPPGCSITAFEDIAGKRITVMGLGLNGGGEATVRFLLKHGALVTVTDMKTKDQLAPTLNRLLPEMRKYGRRLKFILGGHREEDFSSADIVIKNPGVK